MNPNSELKSRLDIKEKLQAKYDALPPGLPKMFVGLALIVLIVGGYAVYAGSFLEALSNLVSALRRVGQMLFSIGTLSPASRFGIALLLGLILFLTITLVNKYVRKIYLRNSINLLVTILVLSFVAIFVSARPGPEPVPILDRIVVIIPQLSSTDDTRISQLEKAVVRAEKEMKSFASKYPYRTRTSTTRRSLQVDPLILRNSATAKREILELLRARPFGYLILPASPVNFDYSGLLDALQDEVVTFVVHPVDLSREHHYNSMTIYPSPEREAEWMAQHMLGLGVERIALFYSERQSRFIERCHERFGKIMLDQGKIHPYKVDTYGTSSEARRIAEELMNEKERPEAIYIVDTGPEQTEFLNVVSDTTYGYHGVLATTSYLLDFIDPRSTESVLLNITVPWPMATRFAKVFSGEISQNHDYPEMESITAASLYSAIVLTDFVHHEVETIRRKDIYSHFYDLSHHIGDELLPLGPISFSETKEPPKSDFAFQILVRASSQ